MKRNILFISLVVSALAILVSGCNNSEKQAESAESEIANPEVETTQSVTDIKPQKITTAQFKELVWDYEKNPEQWTYKGDLPCIVDFYADWCKPCKMIAPIMDDLADEYDGKMLIYKVNTDEERELASVFQVRSIPAILFAPIEGKPAMQPGALSKEDYKRIIDDFVLKINDEENKQKQS